uniref:Uncharacterized protein n=1 Tax=Oryza barthii TaxID=65489 RepID=A0A0D3G508_9ORYZ
MTTHSILLWLALFILLPAAHSSLAASELRAGPTRCDSGSKRQQTQHRVRVDGHELGTDLVTSAPPPRQRGKGAQGKADGVDSDGAGDELRVDLAAQHRWCLLLAGGGDWRRVLHPPPPTSLPRQCWRCPIVLIDAGKPLPSPAVSSSLSPHSSSPTLCAFFSDKTDETLCTWRGRDYVRTP